MTAPFIETSTWQNVVTMPVDGEVGDADDFLASTIGPIVNRTGYLRERLVGVGPTTYRRLVPISDAVWHEMDVSAFLLKTDPFLPRVPHIEATGLAGDFWIPLHAVLPPYGKIVRFGIVMYGATAHVGLPAVMPNLQLVRRQASYVVADAPEVIDQVADPSPDTNIYQGTHFIEKVVDHTIDPNRDYYIRVESESGTNALVGAIFLAPSIDIVGV